MSKLSKKQIQDLMINMYPNNANNQVDSGSKTQFSNNRKQSQEKVQEIQNNKFTDSRVLRQNINIDPLNKLSNKNRVTSQRIIDKKIIFSLLIGLISVGLFSQYFLNVVENLCIKKNVSAFDINGRPKKKLLFVLFFIIVIVSRIFFSYN
jgi:hypothetical protein